MSRNLFHISACTLIAAAVAAMMGACSDAATDEPAGGVSGEDDGMMSFSLADPELEPMSRYSSPFYDGIHTSFLSVWLADGTGSGVTSTFADTRVGCIIAYVNADGSYEYLANTAWVRMWDAEVLSLQERGYDADNNVIANMRTDDRIFTRYSYDRFRLRTDRNFAFFFYYPYNDPTHFKDEAKQYLSGNVMNSALIKRQHRLENHGGSYLLNEVSEEGMAKETFNSYILGAFVGQTDWTGYEGYRSASWRNYPVVPMKDFRTLEGTQNTAQPYKDIYQLIRSDFMFARVASWHNKPLNGRDTQGDIRVTLRKQLATIDLCFDQQPTDVRLVPRQVNGANMSRYAEFNFTTGRFRSTPAYTDYAGLKWEGWIADCLDYDAGGIHPRYLGTTVESTPTGDKQFWVYRLIMTPQKEFAADVEMTIGGQTYTLQNLQNNAHFSSIERGTYYKIRFREDATTSNWYTDIGDWTEEVRITLNRP
ncbi:MAG: hypothetical protein K2M12_05635 [Muribaculaceae bacterium]|nr:hypothetical protein [Muribaculaceae bacterium]